MNHTLTQIAIDYEDVWHDRRRFKAILNDFLPTDKILRNQILISVDEDIPDRLSEEIGKERIRTLIQKYGGILKNAIECNDQIADEIICMWFNAISIVKTYKIIRKDPIDFIMNYSLRDDLPQYRLLRAVFGERARVSSIRVNDRDSDQERRESEEWYLKDLYILGLDELIEKKLYKHGVNSFLKLCSLTTEELETQLNIDSESCKDIENNLRNMMGFELKKNKTDLFFGYLPYVNNIIIEHREGWKYELAIKVLVKNIEWSNLLDYSQDYGYTTPHYNLTHMDDFVYEEIEHDIENAFDEFEAILDDFIIVLNSLDKFLRSESDECNAFRIVTNAERILGPTNSLIEFMPSEERIKRIEDASYLYPLSMFCSNLLEDINILIDKTQHNGLFSKIKDPCDRWFYFIEEFRYIVETSRERAKGEEQNILFNLEDYASEMD